MDVNMQWRDFAVVMQNMFVYGSLWIHMDQLEVVREVMAGCGQDTRAISRDLLRGYQQMGTLHHAIQSWIRPYCLVLGLSTNQCSMVIEEEMD